MKKLLFIFAFVSLFSGRAFAQLDSVYFTSLPCYCFGGSSTITSNAVPNATGYEWSIATGHINSVWFNGQPGPVQTSGNSVNISCQLPSVYYIICVTAYNATDSSNTFCDTIFGTVAEPVLSITNNTIALPGTSGLYAVDSVNCPATYIWTVTGAIIFDAGGQITGTSYPFVNLNFGPNFTSGILCVQAISPFGVPTDTVCMTIYAPVGINDITGSLLSSYYQPNLQQVALVFSKPANQKISINSYDIAGRLVSQEQHAISTDTKEIFVSTAGFKKGVYFVEVKGTDFRKTLKIAVTD